MSECEVIDTVSLLTVSVVDTGGRVTDFDRQFCRSKGRHSVASVLKTSSLIFTHRRTSHNKGEVHRTYFKPLVLKIGGTPLMRTWGYLGRGRMNLTLSHRSDFSLFDEELLFQKNSSGELWANTCRCVDMGSVGLHNSSIYKRGPQQKEIWNHMWFMQTVP